VCIASGVGLDISRVRVERARSDVPAHYPALAGRVAFEPIVPGQPLPLADASADIAISCVVLEFVDDIFRTMDELARIVRPGGHLVAAVANVGYVRHVMSLLQSRTPVTSIGGRDMRHWREHGWDGGALRYFGKRTFADLLVDSGFAPEAWSGCGKFARLRRFYLNGFGCMTVRARRR
jgi:SAM-dependent methyltransferase